MQHVRQHVRKSFQEVNKCVQLFYPFLVVFPASFLFCDFKNSSFFRFQQNIIENVVFLPWYINTCYSHIHRQWIKFNRSLQSLLMIHHTLLHLSTKGWVHMTKCSMKYLHHRCTLEIFKSVFMYMQKTCLSLFVIILFGLFPMGDSLCIGILHTECRGKDYCAC